jgi:hypothetical protein
MKKLMAVVAFVALTTPALAMPIAPIQSDDVIVQIRKGGGSSRSAVSGRFVTRGYANKHKSTTVTHGKY